MNGKHFVWLVCSVHNCSSDQTIHSNNAIPKAVNTVSSVTANNASFLLPILRVALFERSDGIVSNIDGAIYQSKCIFIVINRIIFATA